MIGRQPGNSHSLGVVPQTVSEASSSPVAFSFRNKFRRPTKIGRIETLAELRVARRYNWNLDSFRKTGRRGYRLLKPCRLLLRPIPRIDVVRIPYWLRFGNSISQLVNAFLVAQKLNIRTLQFGESHPCLTGEVAGPFQIEWKNTPPSSTGLEGEFFNLNALNIGSISSKQLAHVYAKLVRPMLTKFLRKADSRIRPDDLVLHFRSGDVFKRSPHSGYAQPPLSYYLAAVDREMPSRVWLVFENRLNPCIDAAKKALEERGIEVLFQSGTLQQDVRLLLSAASLVASRGSFTFTIAHLSKRLRKVYFFEKKMIGSFRQLGLDVVIGRDADGKYRSRSMGKWANSEEQRSLMLSYPAEHLKFEENPIEAR